MVCCGILFEPIENFATHSLKSSIQYFPNSKDEKVCKAFKFLIYVRTTRSSIDRCTFITYIVFLFIHIDTICMKWWFCHAIWLSVSLSPLFGAFMPHTIFNGDLVNSIWIFGLAVGQPNRLTIWLVWHKLAFCVRRMDVSTLPPRRHAANRLARAIANFARTQFHCFFFVFRISFGVCSVSVCLLPYSCVFRKMANHFSCISNWNLRPAEGHDQRSITICVCISYWQIGILRNGCNEMKSDGTGYANETIYRNCTVRFIWKMKNEKWKKCLSTSFFFVITISLVSLRIVT